MSEVTNVLMTADTVGGVWTYAVELCRALALHGVEVALATMGAPLTDDQRRQADALPNVRVHESGYKLEWMADPWDDVARAGDWLLGIERDFRPDVVHLNGYAHGSLAWESPVLVVGHSCVCSWWQAVKGEPAPPAEWGRYRQAVADGLCGADMVVAPTRAMLSALRRHYDLPPSSTVIHNGRDRSPYRLGAKEPLVLCAGRLWDEAKNLAALEAAAPHLPWPVYAAGEGGDSQRVHTLGRLGEAELAGWFARAAVYALPARYEPFGLSALEAGLSGCALVLGDIDSLREVWGDAAEYVPPADAGALLDALWRLIDSPGRRAEMGRRAYERALRYTPARMAQGYVAAYAETRRGQRERTAAYVTAD